MTTEDIELVRDTIKADTDMVTDSTIRMWWARAISFLQNGSGTTIDFEADAEAKGLLLDYCRYIHNNATEYFSSNFREDIQRLNWREAVKNHANKSTDNAEGGDTA